MSREIEKGRDSTPRGGEGIALPSCLRSLVTGAPGPGSTVALPLSPLPRPPIPFLPGPRWVVRPPQPHESDTLWPEPDVTCFLGTSAGWGGAGARWGLPDPPCPGTGQSDLSRKGWRAQSRARRGGLPPSLPAVPSPAENLKHE